MKKLLSVLLAVIMLFSTVAISASAATPLADANLAMTKKDAVALANPDHQYVVIRFVLNGFTVMDPIKLYDTDTKTFTFMADVKNEFYMIPEDGEELYVGASVELPVLLAPEGRQFTAWECRANGVGYGAGTTTITENMLSPNTGNLITFEVNSAPSAPAEDTMGSIMGILTKVFGAIIGLLFYNGNTEAGVQLMEKVLGGILG